MRREIIIALFAIMTGIISIWGFKYISGQNLLSGDKTFHTIIDNAKQINTATPVLVNGYQVGTVNSIEPVPDNIKQIRLGFQVKKEILLPQNTHVEIRSESPMGGRELVLIFDKYCNGSNCAVAGSTFESSVVGMLGSIISQDELQPHINALTSSFDKTIGNLGKEGSDAELDKTIRNLSITMDNLAQSTSRFSDLMNNSSKNLEITLANMAILTESLVSSNDKLSGILNDLGTLTSDLAKVSMSETVGKANKTIDQATTSLASVEGTMTEAQVTVKELSQLIAAMGDEKGSLGLMMKDKDLYNNLEATTKNMDLLLQDIRLNPRRYFKVFGKKVPDYELPKEDPAK